jgi:hypothetical protein
MNSASPFAARVIALAASGVNDYDNTGYVGILRQSSTNIGPYRNGTYTQAVTPYSTRLMNTTYFDGTNQYTTTNGGTLSSNASTGSFTVSAYRIANNTNSGDTAAAALNGFIGEILVYNRSLTLAQRQQVEGYLAWKWGLVVNLPADHPYKTTPVISSFPFPSVISPSILTVAIPNAATNRAVFTPRQISGCQLWLDAADPSAFTLTGSNVTLWKDKSGNANNSTTVIGTPILNQKAINGFSAIRVQTGSYFYFSPLTTAANTTTVSAFVVANLSNSPANTFGRLLSFGNTADGTNNFDYQTVGNFIFCRENANQQMAIYRNSLVGPNVTMNVTYEQPFLMNAVFNGTNCSSFLNGTANTSFSSSGTFTFNQLGIGVNINTKTNPSDVYSGLIAEVIVYYAALSTSERQQTEGYLAWKWGLISSLPNGHPYKQPPIAPFPYAVRRAVQGSHLTPT